MTTLVSASSGPCSTHPTAPGVQGRPRPRCRRYTSARAVSGRVERQADQRDAPATTTSCGRQGSRFRYILAVANNLVADPVLDAPPEVGPQRAGAPAERARPTGRTGSGGRACSSRRCSTASRGARSSRCGSRTTSGRGAGGGSGSTKRAGSSTTVPAHQRPAERSPPAAASPAPAPPESSGSYRASGGGLQVCSRWGVRARRRRCGCRARTARQVVLEGGALGGRTGRRRSALRPRGSCRPSSAIAFEHHLTHRAQGEACVPLQPMQMPFEARDRRQVHRGPRVPPRGPSTWNPTANTISGFPAASPGLGHDRGGRPGGDRQVRDLGAPVDHTPRVVAPPRRRERLGRGKARALHPAVYRDQGRRGRGCELGRR